MDLDDIIQLPTHEIYDQIPMDLDRDESLPVPDNEVPTVSLPPRFIFVKHHPHANKPNEIISLDSVPSLAPSLGDNSRTAPPETRPWAPFISYADYKFASRCVRRCTPNAEIDEDLNDHHNHAFSSDCFITFRNHRDMEKSLAVARNSNISVCSASSYLSS